MLKWRKLRQIFGEGPPMNQHWWGPWDLGSSAVLDALELIRSERSSILSEPLKRLDKRPASIKVFRNVRLTRMASWSGPLIVWDHFSNCTSSFADGLECSLSGCLSSVEMCLVDLEVLLKLLWTSENPHRETMLNAHKAFCLLRSIWYSSFVWNEKI